MTKTIELTDDNFEQEISNTDIPILVDYWAEWCGPCKMVGPILEEISDEMANDIVIAKHDICLLYTSPSPRDDT